MFFLEEQLYGKELGYDYLFIRNAAIGVVLQAEYFLYSAFDILRIHTRVFKCDFYVPTTLMPDCSHNKSVRPHPFHANRSAAHRF